MRTIGRDPLTWSFVKLFGLQIAQDLQTFEGIPASHAWRWRRGNIWRARLLTKAQCVGVLVSIRTRVDRVEFLVDDGTAFITAVLWSPSWEKDVTLGDLVHIEGKLNMTMNWETAEAIREVRLVRISKVEDPNEELLHWVQVMELSDTIYSSSVPNGTQEIHQEGGDEVKDEWETIVSDAFFHLSVDPLTKQHFLARNPRESHDDVLLETLELVLAAQKNQKKQHTQLTTRSDGVRADDALRVTFRELLEHAQTGLQADEKKEALRALRRVFYRLCASGLLYLENTDTDRHILLTCEYVLKPALLLLLKDRVDGISIAEIADSIFMQRQFQQIPLGWLEIALQKLLQDQQIVQQEDSQLFYLNT